MSRIVGIDLGTTNSLVAYVDEKTGLPRVIPDQEGRGLLPSVVSFTTEGVVVGEAAKRLLVRRPATTVYSVKRLMGRGYEDVKEELCYLPFKVAPWGRSLNHRLINSIAPGGPWRRARRSDGAIFENTTFGIPP